MKVNVGDQLLDMRAVWIEGNAVKYIDQSQLPHNVVINEARTSAEIANAILTMKVRGAPSLGAFAAMGLAIALKNGEELNSAYNAIRNTRPTANDLFFGLDVVKNTYESGGDVNPIESANHFVDKLVEQVKKIGEYGEPLIKDGYTILTHCNAGALATVDWGTAISPIRAAVKKGKKVFVYVDETRPMLQGARLTSWELKQEGIDHAIIADNAAGLLMYSKKIDMVIVGADRIAANGDFANKIGTYEKAVLAKENGIPFYVAAPFSTFDKKIMSGNRIPIEERPPEEVLNFGNCRTAPEGVKAYNPAFDVTSSRYVTGYITPMGVYTPNLLFLVFSKVLPR